MVAHDRAIYLRVDSHTVNQNKNRRSRMSITTEVTTITPAVATALLATNTNNRSIRKARVEQIAKDIVSGDFVMNGDTVRISKSGKLIDGQHRLSACVKANKSIRVIMVSGLEDEMFAHIDNGAARSASDTLQTAGNFKNVNALAAAIRAAYAYSMGEARTKRLSNAEVLDLARGSFSNMAVFSDTVGKLAGITRNARVCAAAYLISKKAPASDVVSFFNRVRLGEGLKRGMPEYTLREWLYKASAADFSKHHVKRRDTITACITAWNRFADGKQLRSIHIRSEEVEPKACK
jgi:anti-sigma28 factor (negative regulator of flagellin synthesis)